MNMGEDQVKRAESKKVRRDNKKIEAALVQRIEKLNGNEKFRKLVAKAEKAINKQMSEY